VRPDANECRARGHRRLLAVRRILSEDIRRYLTKSPENIAAGDTFKTRLGAFLTPQIQATLLHRVAHCLHAKGWRRLARIVSGLNLAIHKVNISPRSCIGPGMHLPHPCGVTFDGTAGPGLTIYSLGTCGPRVGTDDASPPRLGAGVTVGGHAAVVGPVTVGDGVTIGPKVCLDEDAPAEVTVVSRGMRGVPTPLESRTGSIPDSPPESATIGDQ
jgi:serine O-acetyltransferase